MQNFIRKIVQAIGKPLEKLSKKPHSSVGSSAPSETVVQVGEKTSEITLPEARVRKVLEKIETQGLLSLIPNLSGRKVLQISASGARLWESLKSKGCPLIIDFDANPLFGTQLPAVKPSGVHLVRGSLQAAPFQNESFEVLCFLGATPRVDQLPAWAEEISRLTKEGARILISILHPFFEQKLNPRQGFQHSIADYFMGLRKVGVYVEEIKELKVDDQVRSLFSPAKEDKDFIQMNGFPAVLCFKAVRLKRR
ncbi:MAG: hypothetical protein JNK65_07105 [Deltaproteobacteria bacterium]|nr:hypothetical protein [Deltaproteobacteria bacterium]